MSIANNQALALAKQFNIQGDSAELVQTLKQTVFKAERIKDAKDGAKPEQPNPFGGQHQDPRRPQIVEAGEKAAGQGIESYKAWFAAIGKEERHILGADEHNRLKTLAENTIQADPRPSLTDAEFDALAARIATGDADMADAAAYALTAEQQEKLDSL